MSDKQLGASPADLTVAAIVLLVSFATRAFTGFMICTYLLQRNNFQRHLLQIYSWNNLK